ncbi:hypothetical protein GJAV_G00211140 [Gymnothorax javanicus]|nr:hypothetical protein GJAV_G00211140 [Gymnothorax javanicus]
MDVRISLSVSLMRDQLGAVIEQAVTNAVETVLEEMLKVVGCKFEEFTKEMTAKERENESIRKMLEISRCQMKTLRKYLNAVSEKDERNTPVNQTFGTRSEPDKIANERGAVLQSLPTMNPSRKELDRNVSMNRRTDRVFHCDRSVCSSEGFPEPPRLQNGKSLKDQDFAVTKTRESRSSDPHMHQKEDLPRIKEEHRDKIYTNNFSQGVATQILDFDNPSSHKLDSSAAAATTGVSPHAKEEGTEMQLTCIKEEPLELEVHTLGSTLPESDYLSNHHHFQQSEHLSDQCGLQTSAHLGNHCHQPLDSLRRNLHHQLPEPDHFRDHCDLQPPDHLVGDLCGDPGSGQDGAGPADGLMGSFTGISSSTSWVGGRQAECKTGEPLAPQLQPRVDLRGCRQPHRREREKSLPSSLQAALVQERREKTRIRVARWRAKRKMQAAAAAAAASFTASQQPAHLNRQPRRPAHDNALRRHQQYRGAVLGDPSRCENVTVYPLQQVGQELTDSLVPPELPLVPHGVLVPDSELLQYSGFEG